MFKSTWTIVPGSYNSEQVTHSRYGTKLLMHQYYLDVIGTSYCRSRAIACTKQ